MKMCELAVQYRESAALLRERIRLLQSAADGKSLTEMERLRLRERIAGLEEIRRETADTAAFLEHYYERGYRRNRRFTF